MINPPPAISDIDHEIHDCLLRNQPLYRMAQGADVPVVLRGPPIEIRA